MGAEQIERTVRDYIVREFLPGQSEDSIQETTPLISGGILDSVSTIKLVSFLEESYGIEFDAHEVSEDHLDTVATIAEFVQDKMGRTGQA